MDTGFATPEPAGSHAGGLGSASDLLASERRAAAERAAAALAVDLTRFEPGPDDTPDEILDAFMRKAVCCHPDVIAHDEYKLVPDDLWEYEDRGKFGKWIAKDRNGHYKQKMVRPSQPPPLDDVTMAYLDAWQGRRPRGTRFDFARLCAQFADAVRSTEYDTGDLVRRSGGGLPVFHMARDIVRRKRVEKARHEALDQPWLRVVPS